MAEAKAGGKVTTAVGEVAGQKQLEFEMEATTAAGEMPEAEAGENPGDNSCRRDGGGRSR